MNHCDRNHILFMHSSTNSFIHPPTHFICSFIHSFNAFDPRLDTGRSIGKNLTEQGMASRPRSALKTRVRVECVPLCPSVLLAQTPDRFPLPPNGGRGEKMPMIKSHFYFFMSGWPPSLALSLLLRASNSLPITSCGADGAGG